jgi:hypothetical protein
LRKPTWQPSPGRLQVAVLKDAKLDVTALSEPIERMIDKPPPDLLSNAKLNVMEEDKQPTELTERSEPSDSDSKEERGPAEELQQAEVRPVAEEQRRRDEYINESTAGCDANVKGARHRLTLTAFLNNPRFRPAASPCHAPARSLLCSPATWAWRTPVCQRRSRLRRESVGRKSYRR